MMKSMGEKDLVLSLRAQGATTAEARDLVAVAGALALVPDPEIDATFADALEATLMAEFDQQVSTVKQLRPVRPAAAGPVAVPSKTQTSKPAAIATVTPLPRRKLVLRKTLAAAIAAVLIMALPVAASANALPSSPLYKGKLAIEEMRLFFTTGEMAKGFYHLERAKLRGEEMAQEAALGHTEVLVKVAALMQAEQRTGMRLILGANPNAAQLAQAADALRDISQQLTTLLPQVPQAVRPPIIATVNMTNDLANRLATSLNGTSVLGLTLPALPEAETPEGSSAPAPSTPDAGSSPSAPTPPEDPGNGDGDTGKKSSDIQAPEACQVPGSANGLTDVTAPLAKVFCE